MHIILIALETKEMAEKRSIIWEFFQCVKTPSMLFATLARQKFQGVEVVQSYIQLQIK